MTERQATQHEEAAPVSPSLPVAVRIPPETEPEGTQSSAAAPEWMEEVEQGPVIQTRVPDYRDRLPPLKICMFQDRRLKWLAVGMGSMIAIIVTSLLLMRETGEEGRPEAQSTAFLGSSPRGEEVEPTPVAVQSDEGGDEKANAADGQEAATIGESSAEEEQAEARGTASARTETTHDAKSGDAASELPSDNGNARTPESSLGVKDKDLKPPSAEELEIKVVDLQAEMAKGG